jgi:hypothetical protein
VISVLITQVVTSLSNTKTCLYFVCRKYWKYTSGSYCSIVPDPSIRLVTDKCNQDENAYISFGQWVCLVFSFLESTMHVHVLVKITNMQIKENWFLPSRFWLQLLLRLFRQWTCFRLEQLLFSYMFKMLAPPPRQTFDDLK